MSDVLFISDTDWWKVTPIWVVLLVSPSFASTLSVENSEPDAETPQLKWLLFPDHSLEAPFCPSVTLELNFEEDDEVTERQVWREGRMLGKACAGVTGEWCNWLSDLSRSFCKCFFSLWFPLIFTTFDTDLQQKDGPSPPGKCLSICTETGWGCTS